MPMNVRDDQGRSLSNGDDNQALQQRTKRVMDHIFVSLFLWSVKYNFSWRQCRRLQTSCLSQQRSQSFKLLDLRNNRLLKPDTFQRGNFSSKGCWEDMKCSDSKTLQSGQDTFTRHHKKNITDGEEAADPGPRGHRPGNPVPGPG